MEPPGETYLQLLFILPEFFSFSVITALVLMGILLICSGLASGTEAAFFTLSPAQLRELHGSSSRRHKAIRLLLENPKMLLATILIANNFVNIGIVILSTFITAQLRGFGENPLLVFFIQVVAVSFLILLFGEVLPKVYAAKYPLYFASMIALPMLFLRSLISPLSSLLISSTSFIDNKIKKKGYSGSVKELSHALELMAKDSMDIDEQRILRGIVKFGNTDVKQIMRSRGDVDAFEYHTEFNELMAAIVESGHSRIPIYKGAFDNVSGVLYIKDLLPHFDKPAQFKWQSLIRPPFFVPENKKIDDLLKEFQQKKNHLAIVVDEYGGTSGIVTLEDIIEEIVGDITDEFDVEDIVYSKLDENNYIFEGKAPLIDLYRAIGIDGAVFEDAKGDADTLAGFILELSGRIPRKEEIICFRNFFFTIEAADKRKIKRVKITVEPEGKLTDT